MKQSIEPILNRNPIRFLLSLILCLSLIITPVFPSSYAADPMYSNASDWAKPEIQKASDAGLLPAMLQGKDLTKPATREELCELAVLLYEKLGKQTLAPVTPNPFTDTTNQQILKALGIGITKGTTSTTFSPESKTTREQVATMFGRVIQSLYAQLDFSPAGAPVFTDQSLISSYALNHVLYMSKEGILKGSGGKFMPRPVTTAEVQSDYGTTRREEAIAITVRIYAAYLNTPVMQAVSSKEKMALSFISKDPVLLAPKARFDQIDFDRRVFRPVYQPKLILAAGDGFDLGGNRTYSSAPNAVLIRSDGTGIHPFQWKLPADVLSRTNAIVWQVSRVPFDGKPTGALTMKPPGLLLSGTLPKSSTSFQIDFKKVHQIALGIQEPKRLVGALGLTPNLITPNLITPNLPKLDPLLEWNVNALQIEGKNGNSLPTTYYVRAYPVDSVGASIGDTGSGLPVQFGDPVPAKTEALSSLITTKNFLLQAAEKQGAITTTEFPNLYGTYPERPMWNTSSKLYYFRPAGFPANTQELILQVTMTTPSSVANSAWQNAAGLVYEKSYFPNEQIYRDMWNSTTSGVPVDFTSLIPSDTQLGDQKIPYYVRFIALTDGSYPAGSVNARYSDTVTVLYQKAQSTAVKFLPQVKIEPDIPTITGFSYHPVQWEDPNWAYRYYVFRKPTAKDVFGSMFPDQPYTAYPVGTKLDLTPKPVQDKSWWEEAWDAIGSFLSDLGSFLKDLTNWVANAYNGLKSGLINFIAQALPFGEPIDGLLKTAIEGMVNYGLVAVGLPPSLPNFDELADLGTGYLAAMALEQAGIPANETLVDGVQTLGEGISKEMTSSSKNATPNPLDWNFVKYDPDYLYKPGYLLITLENQTKEATPKGTLNFSTSCYLDPLTNKGKNNVQDQMWNRYGVAYVSVYKPISLEIPSMAPGQILTIPVFLEEYYGVPFPGTTLPVDRGFLRMMYWDLGKHEFNVSIGFELKPLAQEVLERKLPAEAIYSYSSLGLSRTFTIEPYYPVN